YIPHVAEGLKELLGFDEIKKKEIEDNLTEILEQTRGELEEITIDNPEYDPEFAAIGREETYENDDDDDENNEDEDDFPKKVKSKKVIISPKPKESQRTLE
ncbi:hypothetical protein HQ489_01660, partial [Candidatus Woesearchaeota archaeon]|nr:hypothetical protein [Candidatus Woesearchaeota archaeon]